MKCVQNNKDILLSCKPRMTMTSWFVYKDIRADQVSRVYKLICKQNSTSLSLLVDKTVGGCTYTERNEKLFFLTCLDEKQIHYFYEI